MRSLASTTWLAAAVWSRASSPAPTSSASSSTLGTTRSSAREQLLGRDVLRIEVLPDEAVQRGAARPNKKLRDKDERIDEKMNKVAFVTLWVEPGDAPDPRVQLPRHRPGLPPRTVNRATRHLRASMKMTQPFPGVWLPDTIQMRFGLTLATGSLGAQYDVRYRDYRLADVKTRVR